MYSLVYLNDFKVFCNWDLKFWILGIWDCICNMIGFIEEDYCDVMCCGCGYDMYNFIEVV